MCLIWLMWKTGVKNALVFFQTKAQHFATNVGQTLTDSGNLMAEIQLQMVDIFW